VPRMKANLLEALVFYVHRHSQAHLVKPQVENVALRFPHYHNLAKEPHTLKDAMVLLHHTFPLFPHLANRAFHLFSV
jgi:hypothetical protein